jgi:hypothetical protein
MVSVESWPRSRKSVGRFPLSVLSSSLLSSFLPLICVAVAAIPSPLTWLAGWPKFDRLSCSTFIVYLCCSLIEYVLHAHCQPYYISWLCQQPLSVGKKCLWTSNKDSVLTLHTDVRISVATRLHCKAVHTYPLVVILVLLSVLYAFGIEFNRTVKQLTPYTVR